MKTSNNIVCTVSAGYSSMMMAIKIKEWYPNDTIIYLFANTGMEDERSLQFLKECSDYYGLDIIYLEPILNTKKGKGTNYKVVKFEELDRTGWFFELGISIYGIPSRANKWCNRELKLIPMTKFSNDYFGFNNWCVALGIRIDEMDRFSENYKTNNLFYPLVENKIDSRERNKFWSTQSIKLNIKAYEGNCTMCFEKSDRKRMTIANEYPDKVIWWDEMENKYGHIKIEGKPVYNDMIDLDGRNNFGRLNKSIEWIVEQAKKPFRSATDEYIYESDLFDAEDECGVSCNVF
jgi:3'-phosphoadenosine 5'-phosphosulfate sulfotransferase (PAPS reductase)/FAD synthetase